MTEIRHTGLVLSGLLCIPTSSILLPCEAKLCHMLMYYESWHQSQPHPLNIEDRRFLMITLTRLDIRRTRILRYDQRVVHRLDLLNLLGLLVCMRNLATLHSLKPSGNR